MKRYDAIKLQVYEWYQRLQVYEWYQRQNFNLLWLILCKIITFNKNIIQDLIF